jgi:hypothetical protein
MKRNRKIGPVLATMLVANNMIGSGIFLLPATLATVGSITIVGWLLATVGALLSAAVLAKLGQIAPVSGGPVAYAEEALGPYMGFQATVLYWICAWVGNMAIALAAVGYLATFFPGLSLPLNAAFAAAGMIWLVTFINIFRHADRRADTDTSGGDGRLALVRSRHISGLLEYQRAACVSSNSRFAGAGVLGLRWPGKRVCRNGRCGESRA